MTTETPIQVWEPTFPITSMPNGMPIGGAETDIAQSSIATLDSGRDAALWEGEFVTLVAASHPNQPRTHLRIIPDPAFSASMPLRDVFLTDAAGVLTFSLPIRHDARPTSELAERLRAELGLEAAEAAALLGVSKRSFYEILKRQDDGSIRMGTLRDRVQVLSAMAAEDALATVAMIRRDLDGVAVLLDLGRFTELRARFADARHERLVASFRAAPIRNLADLPREALDTIRNLVQHATMTQILDTIRWVSPDLAADPMIAIEEITRNIEAAHDGERVDDKWKFLVTFDHDEMDRVGDRAMAVIRTSNFSRATWEAFVRAEDEAAWATAGFVPIGMDEADPEPESVSGWEPDLAHGASLKLSDYVRGG